MLPVFRTEVLISYYHISCTLYRGVAVLRQSRIFVHVAFPSVPTGTGWTNAIGTAQPASRPENTLSLTLHQRFRGYTAAQFSNCFLGLPYSGAFYIALRPVKPSALSLCDLIPSATSIPDFTLLRKITTFPYSVKQAQSRQSTCRRLRLRTCVRQEWKQQPHFSYG